jgi:hypothetical protein
MASGVASPRSEDPVRLFLVPTDLFDDMTDTPEDREKYPRLPFEAFDEIYSRYQLADQAALAHQTMHGLLTRFAVGGGCLAVIAAILELPRFLGLPQAISHVPFLATIPLPTDPWAGSLALLGAAFLLIEFFWSRRKKIHQIERSVWIVALILVLSMVVAVYVLFRWESEALVVVEGWAVVVALICWSVGRFRLEKDKWLAFRHEAEVYRQVKFDLLFHSELWGDREGLRIKLNSKEIPSHDDPSKKENRFTTYLSEAICTLPHGPFELGKALPGEGVLNDVVNYYLMKRSPRQMEYLENRTKSNESGDVIWRHLLRWLFPYSVGAALIHLLFTVLQGPREIAKVTQIFSGFSGPDAVVLLGDLATFFALLAALLPAASAGVRAWRGAYEFARNSSRFAAAHAALLDLERSLRTDSRAELISQGDVDTRRVLQELHWCEHILSTEHIEWLRLMVEAEWYL